LRFAAASLRRAEMARPSSSWGSMRTSHGH
jgi:hypothetical protein